MASNLKPVINRDEYNALNDEDKAKYRVYVSEADVEVKAGLDKLDDPIYAVLNPVSLSNKYAFA